MVSMATRNMILKNVGRPTKSIVTRVLLIIEHKTWYQIKAESQAILPVAQYVNHLICISMNINENLKMR